jgi:hypothetical protein
MEKFCDYGCGQKAFFILKNGKFCCSKHHLTCPINKTKIKNASNPWNKGLKKKDDERVRKNSENIQKSLIEYYKTDKSNHQRQITIERNLSSENPWRKENCQGKEWVKKRIETVKETYKNPEIRKKCASNGWKFVSDEGKKSIGNKNRIAWELKSDIQKNEIRKKISEKFHLSISNGTREIKRGKDHPSWKGGYSHLRCLIYANKNLYLNWKFPIFKRDNFKCTNCGHDRNLTIHHDKQKMSEIYHIIVPDDFDSINVSYEEKQKVSDLIAEYHIKNKVSGIVLCKKCHKEIDKSYNFK